MSKHSIPAEGGDFWKKMRYGATAAVTIGTGLYALTSTIKKQGLFSNLVDEVKTALHTTPQLMTGVPQNATMQAEKNDDETRAVLQTHLEFAMRRGDMPRVREITRQLDDLDPDHANASMGVKMPAAGMPQMQNQVAMQTHMSMPTGLNTPINMQVSLYFRYRLITFHK